MKEKKTIRKLVITPLAKKGFIDKQAFCITNTQYQICTNQRFQISFAVTEKKQNMSLKYHLKKIY